MKYIISVLLMFAGFLVGQSSEDNDYIYHKRKNLQLEFGGHAVFYSLNYEFFLITTAKYKTSIQLGASFYLREESEAWFPIGINQLFTIMEGHHLEMGLGHSWHWDRMWGGYAHTSGTLVPHITGRFGYRFQRPRGNYVIRLGFTPYFQYDHPVYWGEKNFIPTGAIAFGFAF